MLQFLAVLLPRKPHPIERILSAAASERARRATKDSSAEMSEATRRNCLAIAVRGTRPETLSRKTD